MKSEGRRESTLLGYSRVLKHLSKNVDLNNPKEVKMFIANKEVKDSRKEVIVTIYHVYTKWRGLTWKRPVYRRDTALPFIPLEKEIDQLISATTRGKTAIFLQFIKESGCRPIEAWRVKWDDIDYEKNLIYLNEPAKHSNPRIFKASSQLMSMINRLHKTSKYLFS